MRPGKGSRRAVCRLRRHGAGSMGQQPVPTGHPPQIRLAHLLFSFHGRLNRSRSFEGVAGRRRILRVHCAAGLGVPHRRRRQFGDIRGDPDPAGWMGGLRDRGETPARPQPPGLVAADERARSCPLPGLCSNCASFPEQRVRTDMARNHRQHELTRLRDLRRSAKRRPTDRAAARRVSPRLETPADDADRRRLCRRSWPAILAS